MKKDFFIEQFFKSDLASLSGRKNFGNAEHHSNMSSATTTIATQLFGTMCSKNPQNNFEHRYDIKVRDPKSPCQVIRICGLCRVAELSEHDCVLIPSPGEPPFIINGYKFRRCICSRCYRSALKSEDQYC
jgi:hypothetical protein